MKELSVFVDESGEEGERSKYYLLSLVFHAQSMAGSASSHRRCARHLNELLRGGPFSIESAILGTIDWRRWQTSSAPSNSRRASMKPAKKRQLIASSLDPGVRFARMSSRTFAPSELPSFVFSVHQWHRQ